jgi:hypothetical protein
MNSSAQQQTAGTPSHSLMVEPQTLMGNTTFARPHMADVRHRGFCIRVWNADKARTDALLLIGKETLAEYIASLGPRCPEDRAGGFPHPDLPGVMVIPIAGGKQALIDAEDYPLVRRYRWQAGDRGYSHTIHCYAGRRFHIGMHRLVLLLSSKSESFVDHINRDPSDNRKENLRLCTHQQNMFNAGGRGAASGIKGVHRYQDGWRGGVKAGGADYTSPKTSDPLEAAAWVRAKREQLHGEFACHG